jgi:hypothetical protein
VSKLLDGDVLASVGVLVMLLLSADEIVCGDVVLN